MLTCAAAPAAALYGTWIAAWISLGHRPEPSLNDPKGINGAVSALHGITVLLIVAFPAIVIMCLPLVPFVLRSARVIGLEGRPRYDRRTIGLAIATLAVGFGSAFLFKSDPGDVLYWFMD
jgi:nitric oxide reductase large subunit